MIIYLVTNKIDGKQYIGQTVQSLRARWKMHCKISSRFPYLKNAIQKYGAEAFSVGLLERCGSLQELNEAEIYWIKLYNTLAPNGYNLSRGGSNREIHEQTRQKMSLSHKCKKLTQEQKTKISISLMGTLRSTETKRKISLAKQGNKNPMYGKKGKDNPNSGKSPSLETRTKMRMSQLGKKRSPKSVAKGIATKKANVKN